MTSESILASPTFEFTDSGSCGDSVFHDMSVDSFEENEEATGLNKYLKDLEKIIKMEENNNVDELFPNAISDPTSEYGR